MPRGNTSSDSHPGNPASSVPHVSIVMPVHNALPYLHEALASVRAQGWPCLELVAVDDGSTDGSATVLDREVDEWAGPDRSLVVIHQENAGAAAARNAGVNRARGALVVFLDADDRLYPSLVGRLAEILTVRPDLDIAFPRYRHVDASGEPLGVNSRMAPGSCTIADLMLGNPIHSATGVMARRSSIETVGGFDEALEGCIDLDLWVRIAALRPGNIEGSSEILVDYRRRAGQITSDWRRMERHWQRVCDKLVAAGRGLTPSELRRGRSLHKLYCAAIAHDAGDLASSRHLVADAVRQDPFFVVGAKAGRIRIAAALASLLPSAFHGWIRTRFKAWEASR